MLKFKVNYNFSHLFLLVLVFLFLFTLGCTQPTSKKVGSGLIIEKVEYKKNITVNDRFEAKVMLKNNGDAEAKNIRIYLEGLSSNWDPKPPLEETVDYLEKGKSTSVMFMSSPPTVEDKRSYPFSFRVEYDYSASYFGILEIIKDERNNTVTLKSSSKSISPLTINLSSYYYDKKRNKVNLKFVLVNKDKGEIKDEVLVIGEDIICDISRVKFKPGLKSSEPINCELSVSEEYGRYWPEFKLKVSFRYIYTSDEYKVSVFPS